MRSRGPRRELRLAPPASPEGRGRPEQRRLYRAAGKSRRAVGPFVGNPHFAELNAALDAKAAKAAKYGVGANAIAAAWVLRHPANIQIVLGSMSPSRLNEMLDGADVTLERQDWWDLYVAAGNLIP